MKQIYLLIKLQIAKLIALLIILSISGYNSSLLFAQSNNFIWTQQAVGTSGNTNENGRSITHDAQGNVYVIGNFDNIISFGITTLSSNGRNDVFLAKYDSSGNLLWARSAGGPSYDSGRDIAVDNLGNVYIVGSFYISVTFDNITLQSNSGYTDIFITKYDTNGNVLWAKSGGGTGTDLVEGIALDEFGNSYITGVIYDQATFDNITLAATGLANFFILKYDTFGTPQWGSSTKGTGYNAGNNITVDKSGSVYVTGSFENEVTFGDKKLISNGSHDIFITKYNTSGAIEWALNQGGISYELSQDIAVDGLGNIYIVGSFSDSTVLGDTRLTSSGFSDIYTAKFDGVGNLVWAKSAGGQTSEYAYGSSLSVDASGNVYIAGEFTGSLSFGATTLIGNSSNSDIFIAKYDPSGNAQWAKSAQGETGYDYSAGVTVDDTGTVYFMGTFYDSINIDNSKLISSGSGETFIAKLNNAGNIQWLQRPDGSTSEDFGRDVAVDILGNTYVTGEFTGKISFGSITLTSDGKFDMFIVKYDVTGKVLWAKRAGGIDDETGQSIVVDEIGNIYVTGTFSGTTTFENTKITSTGSQDVFVSKYNSSGQLIWVRNGGGPGYEWSQDLAVDKFGNPYVVGTFSNTVTFGSTTLTSSGNYDVFLVNYDSAGNLQKASNLGGSNTEYGRSIAIDKLGNILITGTFQSSTKFGNVELTSNGGEDAFILKLDSLRTVKWARSFGGKSYDTGQSIGVDALGNSYVTGLFYGSVAFNDTIISSVGYADVFIAKYDSSGVLKWVNKGDGTGYESVQSVAVDLVGNTYLIGSYSGDLTFGNTLLKSSSHGANIFVTSFNTFGNVRAALSSVGGIYSEGLGISSDKSSNVYITGYFNGKVTYGETELSTVGPSMFLAKLGISDNKPTFSGTTTSPTGTLLDKVTVKLSGTVDNQVFTTSSTGTFSFTPTETGAYTLTPVSRGEEDAMNGISTLDIVQIQRHILAKQLLTSPYKIIASDVNNSGSVTTLDIALIRSLILQNTTSFPGKRMWSFVSSDFSFEDPLMPFPYDSTRTYAKAVNLSNQDFIGIKLGDVNDSWDASTARVASAGNLYFNLQDQQVSPAAEVVVPVTVRGFKDVSGYQFTLNWDPQVLEYAGVTPGELQADYGTHSTDQGKLTTMWTEVNGMSLSLEDGSKVFYVRFKVKGEIGAESKVEINSAITKGVAYTGDLKQLNVQAQQATVKVKAAEYSLQQNSPNPFSESGTSIRFSIPQQEQVSISIYNSLGQLVRNYKATYATGEHELIWDGRNSKGQKLSQGTYIYRMEAGKFSEAKRAIIL